MTLLTATLHSKSGVLPLTLLALGAPCCPLRLSGAPSPQPLPKRLLHPSFLTCSAPLVMGPGGHTAHSPGTC